MTETSERPAPAGTAAGDADLLTTLRGFVGQLARPVTEAPEPVNPAMIRHWCEALGDTNPRYAPGPDQVAPPAMLQAWCMLGLRPPDPDGGLARMRAVLIDAGYTGVVATNCTQSYVRDLRPGDRLREERVIESVSDEKRTALGDGFFVTTRSRYTADGELVGEMTFRTLYFRPKDKPPPRPPRPRPAITQDNEFFFAGAREGKLLIQRCEGCGRLQHPPTPVCPACGSFERGVVEPSGRGRVYSFVVNHHPPVPAFDYPLVVALVELEEGVRLVTNLVGVEPADVHIDMPVEVELVPVDDELTLPMFRPVAGPEEER
ncbi:MAG TPA: bifunctional MaoC family dehydratase N-terminal/OB-fold nucleic acid binding domain-containing protein [Acidimicrobiales bacterium]